ncbi:hypothetical protein XELAEV_18017809mg [Xenopus laevis]|uniref:Uncharacterized protein n=1 Tax=Xenopus laevis TaxID=8355 RepID=A0A974HST1_XENLA|nr:hypothetical protein XELAEV_18017809mg [Xenopus laevis]
MNCAVCECLCLPNLRLPPCCHLSFHVTALGASESFKSSHMRIFINENDTFHVSRQNFMEIESFNLRTAYSSLLQFIGVTSRSSQRWQRADPNEKYLRFEF